jgi:hypothetical protein
MVGSESTYWLFWQEKTTEMVNTVIQLVALACVDRVGGGPICPGYPSAKVARSVSRVGSTL